MNALMSVRVWKDGESSFIWTANVGTAVMEDGAPTQREAWEAASAWVLAQEAKQKKGRN